MSKLTKKQHAVLGAFPDALDGIINEQFPGAEARSRFSIVDLAMVTDFKASGERRKQIRAFVEGFMAGNQELATRLQEQP